LLKFTNGTRWRALFIYCPKILERQTQAVTSAAPGSRWIARIFSGFYRPVFQFYVQSLSASDARFIGIAERGIQSISGHVILGGGTFCMEPIVRQYANDQHVLIIRNGWFRFRWSEILEKGKIAASTTVLAAQSQDSGGSNQMAPFAPAPLDQVVAKIRKEKPAVVITPHVDTSAGMILPDS